MGTSALQQGTSLQIGSVAYILLRKLDAEVWQLEESRSKRIVEFSTNQLQTLYVQGSLRFLSTVVDGQRRSVKGASGMAPSAVSQEQLDTAKIRRLYAIAVQNLPNSEVQITAAVKEVWDKIKAPPAPPHWDYCIPMENAAAECRQRYACPD